jgi:hypothetical protein
VGLEFRAERAVPVGLVALDLRQAGSLKPTLEVSGRPVRSGTVQRRKAKRLMQHDVHLAAKAGARARQLHKGVRDQLRARGPHAAEEDDGGLAGAALTLEPASAVHLPGGCSRRLFT